MIWLSDPLTVRVRLFLAISVFIFNFGHQLRVVISFHKKKPSGLLLFQLFYFVLFYFKGEVM